VRDDPPDDRPASRAGRGPLATAARIDETAGDALIDAAVAELAATGVPITALGIAVSGGADSMALLHLMAGWARRCGPAAPRLHVLTVDHQLRAAAAVEAQHVAAHAQSLGLTAAILTWTGEKPKSGLQDAARAARYQLIADYARTNGLAGVCVAHTADDQAETFLMRLAHGSGVDGLAGMATVSRRLDLGPDLGPDLSQENHQDLTLVRPLLGVRKAALVATLKAAGITWIDDPSNQDLAFERIRVRNAAPVLHKIGLDAAAIGLTAKRLARASGALEAATSHWLDDATMFDGCAFGYCRFDLQRWHAAPEEWRVRALAQLLAVIGGQDGPIGMGQIESLVARLQDTDPKGATLGRCVLAIADQTVTIVREDGRADVPRATLEPGMTARWDNRFHVAWPPSAAGPVEVQALGPEGLKRVKAETGEPSGLPAGALRTLPSFWRSGQLLAVPNLGFWVPVTAPGAHAMPAKPGKALFLATPGYRLAPARRS
jgi:tRNA(Ile)-lysidine synthase